MDAILTIKKPNGRVLGMILSFGGNLSLTNVESDELEKSFNAYINHGVQTILRDGTDVVRISANPKSPDFFDQLSTFLQLCFGLVCSAAYFPVRGIRSSEDILVNTESTSDWSLILFGGSTGPLDSRLKEAIKKQMRPHWWQPAKRVEEKQLTYTVQSYF